MRERIVIKYPSDILRLPCIKRYAGHRQENFISITLDGAHQVIKAHCVSLGTVNKTIVHPREVFYPAIKDNAVAVMFAHNHPGGSTLPSSEDESITERLCKAAKILGFNVLDHVILTKDGKDIKVSSLRAQGLLNVDTEDIC